MRSEQRSTGPTVGGIHGNKLPIGTAQKEFELRRHAAIFLGKTRTVFTPQGEPDSYLGVAQQDSWDLERYDEV